MVKGKRKNPTHNRGVAKVHPVIRIFKKLGVIVEGHFIGASGQHMATYINKDVWMPHTEIVSKIARMIAQENVEAGRGRKIDVVVGPAIGGIALSQWVAFHLSRITGREVLSVFTEKTSEGDKTLQVFKRGYDALVRGKRVLLVEDTITTGSSIKKAVHAVRQAGGKLVHVSGIINRDPQGVTARTLGAPSFSVLAELPLESFLPHEVPEWLAAVPVNTKLGHGGKGLIKTEAVKNKT